MKIVITRHGQTTWNAQSKSKFQGITDIDLSEIGKEQTIKLANKLKEFNFESIYCSPLKRCKDTAKQVSNHHKNLNLIIDDNLKEINFGIFEGLTREQASQKYPQMWKKREENKMEYRIPEGESINDVQKRADKILEKIFQEKKNTLIIAHATINMLLFTRLLNKTFKEVNNIYYENCCLSVFEIDENDNKNIKVETLGCVKHLK